VATPKEPQWWPAAQHDAPVAPARPATPVVVLGDAVAPEPDPVPPPGEPTPFAPAPEALAAGATVDPEAAEDDPPDELPPVPLAPAAEALAPAPPLCWVTSAWWAAHDVEVVPSVEADPLPPEHADRNSAAPRKAATVATADRERGVRVGVMAGSLPTPAPRRVAVV
jgi:hypothetical protein